MVRLFVAIEVPEKICCVLREFQAKLPGKVTRTASFHLTLQFIGEVNDSKVLPIIEALQAITFSSFALSLRNAGVFPSRYDPRVVWIGVEPQAKAVALAKQVTRCLALLQLVPDHEFHPHLTLARIKFLENKKDFLDQVNAWDVPQVSFSVDAFHLIKSTLSRQGPAYEIVQSFPAKHA